MFCFHYYNVWRLLVTKGVQNFETSFAITSECVCVCVCQSHLHRITECKWSIHVKIGMNIIMSPEYKRGTTKKFESEE